MFTRTRSVLFTRFVVLGALTGALFTLSLSPSLALTEAQQDAAIASLQSAVNSLQSKVTSLQNTVNTQAAQIGDLQKKTNAITVATDTTRTDGRKYTEMTFKYVNLHIVNGLGSTSGDPGGIDSSPQTNGLGNVIIGYNALRGSGDIRSGSHNLILGDGQNYGSYAGIVAGSFNNLYAPYSSITGGQFNTVSGYHVSITGGYNNFINNGSYASILGGRNNIVSDSGFGATVSGGFSNTASGPYSSILGGYLNGATADTSCVGGGTENLASGLHASVGAGKHNRAIGEDSSVSGGQFNTANNFYVSIAGGLNVVNSTSSGFAAGGLYSGTDPGPGTFHSP